MMSRQEANGKIKEISLCTDSKWKSFIGMIVRFRRIARYLSNLSTTEQHESFGLKTSLLWANINDDHHLWRSLQFSLTFNCFSSYDLGGNIVQIECWEFSDCVAPAWLLTSILFLFSCVVCRLSSTFEAAQSLQINFHSCHSSWRVMMRERMCLPVTLG